MPAEVEFGQVVDDNFLSPELSGSGSPGTFDSEGGNLSTAERAKQRKLAEIKRKKAEKRDRRLSSTSRLSKSIHTKKGLHALDLKDEKKSAAANRLQAMQEESSEEEESSSEEESSESDNEDWNNDAMAAFERDEEIRQRQAEMDRTSAKSRKTVAKKKASSGLCGCFQRKEIAMDNVPKVDGILNAFDAEDGTDKSTPQQNLKSPATPVGLDDNFTLDDDDDDDGDNKEDLKFSAITLETADSSDDSLTQESPLAGAEQTPLSPQPKKQPAPQLSAFKTIASTDALMEDT